MDQLPKEILYDILLASSLDEILNLSLAYKNARDICNDDYFWMKKTHRDFGNNIKKVSEWSWRTIYEMETSNQKILSIFFDGRIPDDIASDRLFS